MLFIRHLVNQAGLTHPPLQFFFHVQTFSPFTLYQVTFFSYIHQRPHVLCAVVPYIFEEVHIIKEQLQWLSVNAPYVLSLIYATVCVLSPAIQSVYLKR